MVGEYRIILKGNNINKMYLNGTLVEVPIDRINSLRVREFFEDCYEHARDISKRFARNLALNQSQLEMDVTMKVA
jgi:hypothetical protein